MELELIREHFSHYETVLDTQVCQEQTQELIVPDFCADIQRIVDAGGQLCITGKSIQDGCITVHACVNGWVLYEPEDGSELCRIPVSLPFSVKADNADLTQRCQYVISPVLRRLDVRTMNPRKMLLRADAAMGLLVFEPTQTELCCALQTSDGGGVEQLTHEQKAYMTTLVQEKEFSVYEEVRLPGGTDAAGEILCVRAEPVCTDSKLIGNKLLFKGEAGIRVRYMSGGQPVCARIPVAFSQVMEVEGHGEDAGTEVALCVTNLECARAGEDGRVLNITLDVLAQIVVKESFPVVVLQDAYSTEADLTVEQQNCTLARLLEQSVRPVSVRELLEAETAVNSVLDTDIILHTTSAQRQGDTLHMQAQGEIRVLYRDQQDRLQSLCKPVTVTGQTGLSGDCAWNVRCRCPGEVFGTAAAGGVEVRFTPEFCCELTGRQTVPAVCSAVMAERAGQGSAPSVVLRAAMGGETLWDIAKAYGTTTRRICSANALESGQIPAGQLLLIPAAR